MAAFKLLSAIEQVAAHLRTELATGRWSGTMPGVYQLVEELKVSRVTMDAALRTLEKEGLLVPQGAGRRRLIQRPKRSAPPSLRVQILVYEDDCRQMGYIIETQHRLLEAGFTASFAPKTLRDLGMDVKRVASFVQRNEADAWIVMAASREVLEWFSGQSVPAFALFGRFSGIPISAISPRKSPAMATAVQRLVSLGHRRIVMLSREERRKPSPALFEQNFLSAMEEQGVPTGPYNLPDWENSPEGFHRCLDSLLAHTPPTALIIEEPFRFHAAKDYLARRGLVAPEHISLVCGDPDITFSWHDAPVSHIRWVETAVIHRLTNWVNNVARGKTHRRQTYIEAEFVEGGTIGPAPRAKRPA